MTAEPTRRNFLRTGGLLLGGVVAGSAAGELAASPEASAARAGAVAHPLQSPASTESRQWRQARRIRERVHPPHFPRRAFRITEFGAVADGKTKATQAIRDAIDACHRAGGGSVVV